MSNYLSILHNFGSPQATTDFDFVAAALNYKQQKYDTNKAKLQTLHDQIDALSVVKDIDKDYIEGRLQQVRQIANQYSYIDLSDDSFANSMLNNVAQVVDGNVEEAVLSKRRIDSEDREWEEKRIKSPEQYNEKNEAFAKYMSDRRRYYASDKVGDTYKGGAEFIKYVDPDKLAAEIKEKSLKTATHTWIQQGPNYGPFGSISTMEMLSRPEMEGQLKANLSEDAYRQLEINAWAQYEGVDDKDIKERILSKDAETISNLDDYLDKLRMQKSAASEEQQGKYDELISHYESQKQEIEGRDYDQMIQQGGKRSLYSALYKQDFFDKHLEGFDFAPREIKREVDATQKAYLEFSETVRAHRADESLARDKFNWQKQVDKANLSFKYEELAYKQQKDGTTSEDGKKPKPNTGKVSNEAYADFGKVGGAQLNQERGRSVLSDFEKTFTDISESDYAGLRKTLTDKAVQEAVATGKIKIKGKTYNVDDKGAEVLRNFKNEILTESVYDKKAKNAFIGAIESGVNTYSKLAGDNSNWDVNEFTAFTKKVVKDKDGVFRVVTSDPTYAKRLLRKSNKNGFESLAEADQITLKLYVGTNIIGDPNSKATYTQRVEYAKALRSGILKDLPPEELAKIPTRAADIMATFNTMGDEHTRKVLINDDKFKDYIGGLLPQARFGSELFGSSAYTTYLPAPVAKEVKDMAKLWRQRNAAKTKEDKAEIYKQIKVKEQNIEKFGNFVSYKASNDIGSSKGHIITTPTNTAGGSIFSGKSFVSNIEGGRTSYYNNQGNKIRTEDIYEQFDKRTLEADEELKDQYKRQSNFGYNYYKGVKGYDVIKSLALDKGIITPEFTGTIGIEPAKVAADGTPTEYYVYPLIKSTTTKDGNSITKVKAGSGKWNDDGTHDFKGDKLAVKMTTAELMRDYPELNLVAKSYTRYNAKFGDDAPSEYLGRSISVQSRGEGDRFYTDIQTLQDKASLKGPEANRFLKESFDNYNNGLYEFKLEPYKEIYGVGIYLNGKRKYFVPKTVELQPQDVTENQRNPEPIISDAFYNYIESEIEGK